MSCSPALTGFGQKGDWGRRKQPWNGTTSAGPVSWGGVLLSASGHLELDSAVPLLNRNNFKEQQYWARALREDTNKIILWSCLNTDGHVNVVLSTKISHSRSKKCDLSLPIMALASLHPYGLLGKNYDIAQLLTYSHFLTASRIKQSPLSLYDPQITSDKLRFYKMSLLTPSYWGTLPFPTAWFSLVATS